jgi:hypothetical protein
MLRPEKGQLHDAEAGQEELGNSLRYWNEKIEFARILRP